LIFLCFSCQKEDEKEFTELNENIVFTDSFSPSDWENPTMRKKIEYGDKDIGAYIEKDVTDPRLRQIITLIEKFAESIKNTNVDELKSILSPSAYNSYMLRFSDKSFKEDYILRVAYPDDYLKEVFIVKYKILLKEKSIIGSIEIDFSQKEPIISDFEPEPINKIFNMD